MKHGQAAETIKTNNFKEIFMNAKEYYERGEKYSEEGNYDEAISDFTEVIKLEPNNHMAYDRRGSLYMNKKEFDLAIADFTEAIRLDDPPTGHYYFDRALAYKSKGNKVLAISDLEMAVKLDPQEKKYREWLEEIKTIRKKKIALLNEISDLQKKAESGDTEAMFQLAQRLVEAAIGIDDMGEDIMDKAFDWLKKAAELGNAEAQHEMAKGCRSEKDFNGSFQWEQKAAKQGLLEAEYSLAIHYQNGTGTPVNSESRYYWLKQAAEKGHTEAKYLLALCYISAQGTKEDIAKAISWLEQASNDGFAPAKINLGAAYNEGKGVPKDRKKGLSLLQEAADLGDENAKEILEEEKKVLKSSKKHIAKTNLQDILNSISAEKKRKLILMAIGLVVCSVIGVILTVNYDWRVGFMLGTYIGIGIIPFGTVIKEDFWNAIEDFLSIKEDFGNDFRKSLKNEKGILKPFLKPVIKSILKQIFIGLGNLIKLFLKFLICPFIAIYRLVVAEWDKEILVILFFIVSGGIIGGVLFALHSMLPFIILLFLLPFLFGWIFSDLARSRIGEDIFLLPFLFGWIFSNLARSRISGVIVGSIIWFIIWGISTVLVEVVNLPTTVVSLTVSAIVGALIGLLIKKWRNI